MSSIIFPSTPSVNDEYTSGGVTWKWNGFAWQILGADDIDARNVKVKVAPVADYTAVELNDSVQDLAGKVLGVQYQNKLNALGDISGATEINLANGFKVTATLTDTVVLSFTGLPPSGYSYSFNLYFMNIEGIIFPVGTKFAGGVVPIVIASPYRIFCEIDSDGVVEVHSVIDNINTPE